MDNVRYFSWDEANALIPELSKIFGAVAQLRAQLRAAYEALDRLGAAPTEANLNESGPPEVMRLRAQFQGLYETMMDELRRVEELGAHVKDIDTGLVDFFHQRDGRDVLLCWRYGEAEIAFWHDLESGFGGRQPLTDADRNRGRILH
jgi:hypothetical protein